MSSSPICSKLVDEPVTIHCIFILSLNRFLFKPRTRKETGKGSGGWGGGGVSNRSREISDRRKDILQTSPASF